MASTHWQQALSISNNHFLKTSHTFFSPASHKNRNQDLRFLPSSTIFSIKCIPNSEVPQPVEPNTPGTLFPVPGTNTLNDPESFPIERRRRAQILREQRRKTDLEKVMPPNYEIGWKRTKSINLEKPTGHVLMDFLDKLLGLMDGEFGSTQLLAKAGEIVAERVREEAEVLVEEGKVEERMATELFRVLKLMEMDLSMVKGSVKEETLRERIEQAKARCRQAILVASSF